MTQPAPTSWSTALDDEHSPPPSTPERRDYLKWLFFAVTRLQPAVLEAFIARGDDDAFARARTAFEAHARTLEEALADRSCLVGDQPTAADVKVSTVLAWAASFGLLAPEAKLAAYARRVCP
jgi:glutathione S-transferase